MEGKYKIEDEIKRKFTMFTFFGLDPDELSIPAWVVPDILHQIAVESFGTHFLHLLNVESYPWHFLSIFELISLFFCKK